MSLNFVQFSHFWVVMSRWHIYAKFEWQLYTHWNSVQPKTLYSSCFPPKLSIFGVSFGWFWRFSELQILKISINLIFRGKAEQKIVIYVTADNDFLKEALYSATIIIKLLPNINWCIKMQVAVPFGPNTGSIFQKSPLFRSSLGPW